MYFGFCHSSSRRVHRFLSGPKFGIKRSVHTHKGIIMKGKTLSLAFLLFFATLFLPPTAKTQEKQAPSPSSSDEKPTLVQATMCASLKEGRPYNSGAVFPVGQGKVLCFTSFDPVPRKTVVYHSWFHRDVLITMQKLTLNPPRWSSYSTIQLREADKGPWRVEITDQEARMIEILRFSITD